MRNSEHFNLFLAEGSDIVNPLVQDVQNYEAIDGQMFKNQNAGVQNATELKNGTVHAITRNVPDAQFITFTATSNYTAGETFTVDGVQVSALTVGGETLPTGAYVINSQVLCVLKGTLLTFYAVGTEVADNSLALNGHPDTYFGTKEEVDNAIATANAANVLANEVNNSLDNKVSKQWLTENSSTAGAVIVTHINASEYKFTCRYGIFCSEVIVSSDIINLLKSDSTYQYYSQWYDKSYLRIVFTDNTIKANLIYNGSSVNDGYILAEYR